MANKPPHSIAQQIALLTARGMLFRNVANAPHFLQNIKRIRFFEWMQKNP